MSDFDDDREMHRQEMVTLKTASVAHTQDYHLVAAGGTTSDLDDVREMHWQRMVTLKPASVAHIQEFDQVAAGGTTSGFDDDGEMHWQEMVTSDETQPDVGSVHHSGAFVQEGMRLDCRKGHCGRTDTHRALASDSPNQARDATLRLWEPRATDHSME